MNEHGTSFFVRRIGPCFIFFSGRTSRAGSMIESIIQFRAEGVKVGLSLKGSIF